MSRLHFLYTQGTVVNISRSSCLFTRFIPVRNITLFQSIADIESMDWLATFMPGPVFPYDTWPHADYDYYLVQSVVQIRLAI